MAEVELQPSSIPYKLTGGEIAAAAAASLKSFEDEAVLDEQRSEEC
jgi:hypothetical protein